MNNQIIVTYDSKTRRLVMAAPFHLGDAIRGFPSRRFDPKSKKWKVPLIAGNIRHLEHTKRHYDYKIDAEAASAIESHLELSAAPKHVPFPRHVYNFKNARVPFDPMQHQDKMLDLSWGLKASAWFAKMGTGKTFAAIHLAMARWLAGEIDGVMIVAPSTLRRTWMKELSKYATAPYDFRIHETKASWLKEFYASRPKDTLRVLAVSVEGLGVSEKLYDSACGFLTGGARIMVICDESSRIKNPQALRTQRAILLGAAAECRLILNGTPIALGIQDLWSQYEFLDPNILGYGDYWAFKTAHIEMGGYERKQIVGYKDVDNLMKLLIPYTCEVGKDVLNLPPKTMKPIYCEASAQQKKLFKLIIKGSTGDPNEPYIKVDNTLEKMLRLRQVVGGFLPRGHIKIKVIDGLETEVTETILEPLAENPKLDLLLSTIEGNYAGSKFIIWTSFIHEIELLRDHLGSTYGPRSVECYYGKTGMEDRSRIEDRYCNDATMRFFIGNPVAAGLGLTLISGENDVMGYYSGTNAYIERAQSEDRAHRIGQSNPVTVVDWIMEKTVDELIQASIAEKMSVEEYVMARIAAGANPDDLLLLGV